MEQVAIFGGSFDPIHIGHLWLAQQVYEIGGRVFKDDNYSHRDVKFDKLCIMPNFSGRSSGKIVTGAEHRLTMCKLALQDINQNFGFPEPVKDLEIQQEFEYTYQTIDFLCRADYISFVWIISSDWDVTKFKNYDELKTKCKFFIVHRPGENDERYGDVRNFLPINIKLSSTQIRDRVKNGKSISGLVTPSVEKYIIDKGLYK